MLMELGIKHRYTRPYRPQTNGKAERFWRTIEDDVFEETNFESIEHIKNEVLEYLVYYNYQRPHQALNGKTPVEFAKNCPRIS
jgi:transposase InsO family protein